MYSISELKNMIRPVAEKYHLEAVYVYGACIKNEAKSSRDVRLFARAEKGNFPSDPYAFANFYADVYDAVGKYSNVVIEPFEELPKQLKESITKEMVQIF